MLTKLKKIKKLGIFSDFTWGTSLQTFGRYNLIYGWNGSGKSTLANLFAGLPVGSVANCSNLEYEIETADGTIVKNSQPFPTKIRVFNRDYVANNVHTISGKAKPILILGEENKKITDEIAAYEMALAAKRGQKKKLEEEGGAAAVRKDKIFSDIAKTIGLNTSGLATRNYRKPDAEKDFAALAGKTQLDDADVVANVLELKQQEKPDVDEIATPSLSFGDEEKKTLSNFLDAVTVRGESLCGQTVESKLVERLRQNADIAQWVERGITLHKTHASKTCEFCDQTLPSERMDALTAHFNEADKKLKKEIEGLLKMLAEAEQSIRKLQLPDKANLYDELQGNYQSATEQFTLAKAALLERIDLYRASMDAKKAKTTESVPLEVGLDGGDLVAGLDAANAAIKKHNEKTANFTPVKDVARKKLETHYLGTIYDEVKDLEKKIADNKLEIDKINDGNKEVAGDVGIIALIERITTNRAKISSSHKGCQEINSALKTFLGRDELQFEVEKEGYVLMRGKKFAENLSEGEKTAIGFVHFVIHLKDQNFDPTNGIVVVDDPVSSLDSNSIFQAFSFLKNSVKDAQQVFLLSHNFDFLRLLINWVSHQPKLQRGYYMIKNSFDASGDRSASLDSLDKLLQEHESEYHYLFKLLHTFQSDGTIESVYNVPNIARKVLDTFLMFRVPSSERNYVKMEALKPHFDENKLTAIYKFTNDQSHITGKVFDPSLVAETQKNVKYLMEMIEAVFPEHYNILVTSISS
jgi:wobble nucleotide-excising tRNase